MIRRLLIAGYLGMAIVAWTISLPWMLQLAR